MKFRGRRSVFLFWAAGAMSGWLLVLGRCSEVRRTGKSACATERRRRSRARGKNWWLCCGVLRAQAEAYATEKRRTLARGRRELAIVLGRCVGTGRNACATERQILVRYYSTVTADMLLRR